MKQIFRSNWNRHIKSKSHTENIKLNEINKRTCENCGRIFTLICHLGSHKKVCTGTKKTNHIVDTDKDIRIKELENKCKMFEIEKQLLLLKKELENKDKLIEEKNMQINLIKDQNTYIKNENDYHKDLVNSAGQIVQSSMNTMTYLLKNYNTSPILESLKDYTVLYNYKNDEEFINNMLHYYEKGKIGQFLGDILLKHYKSDDPKKRPSRNTDTSRLTYINRLLINNQATWTRDNKGLKFTKILIDPFLDHILNINLKFINDCKHKLENDSDSDNSENILKKMEKSAMLVKNIKNRSVAKDINIYCAPQLYFDKNTLIK